MRTSERETLDEEARKLVKLNQREVRSIVRSYIFADPEEKTVRVVHIDRQMFPEESVMPMLFGPDRQYGLSHPMMIAVVDEDAERRLEPPPGWGSWSDATKVDRHAGGKAA
jgi:hypothetical protein